MILKYRQGGVSTGEIIKQLDLVCFNRNKTAVILAHEQDAVKKLFRICARAYDFMNPVMKPSIDRGGGSKYEMYFPAMNSRIYCDLESRGDTISHLHISEAAFMKDSSKMKSTMQAVPLDGIITIETTPNGMSNHFYDMWNDPDSIFKKMFFPWFIFDQYVMPVNGKLVYTDDELEFIRIAKQNFKINITPEQVQFRRFKKAELKNYGNDKSLITFEQEYPEDDQTCFLASGEAVMDLALLKELLDNAPKPILDNGWMRIYKPYDRKKHYVIGADPAEGIGGDYCAAVMICVEDREVVGTLRGHWKPGEFAHKLFDFGKMFQVSNRPWPLLAVERNNHGHAVLLELESHIGYQNLFVALKSLSVGSKDDKLGWGTTMITRPIMINGIIAAIENKYLTVNDRYLIQEGLTLSGINGKIEAADGKHDDLFVAAAIAMQMVLISDSLAIYNDIEKRILV